MPAHFFDERLTAEQATGNAPAWFAGEGGEHAHAAVYSGIKTQEVQSSQNGGGGYNQLVFDGTPSQERAALATTQASSRLHLGAHRQQADNQRGPGCGHGAELAMAAQGAVRGGAGVLINAHAQPQGQGDLLSAPPSAPPKVGTAQPPPTASPTCSYRPPPASPWPHPSRPCWSTAPLPASSVHKTSKPWRKASSRWRLHRA